MEPEMTGVATEKKQSQISTKFSYLEKAVIVLKERRIELQEKLEPITMEKPEKDAGVSQEAKPLCPMAQRIKNIKEDIAKEIDFLADLKNRIEI